MSCPSCTNDFNVKNIPDEVECLVANKISVLDGTLQLPTERSTLLDALKLVTVSGDIANVGGSDVSLGLTAVTGSDASSVALLVLKSE